MYCFQKLSSLHLNVTLLVHNEIGVFLQVILVVLHGLFLSALHLLEFPQLVWLTDYTVKE